VAQNDTPSFRHRWEIWRGIYNFYICITTAAKNSYTSISLSQWKFGEPIAYKNFGVLHSLKRNGRFVFNFLLLKASFPSITRSTRRRRFVSLLVEVSCWQKLWFCFVTPSTHFLWIPSVSGWGPFSRNARILLEHFVKAILLNLFSLGSTSSAAIGDDCRSHNQLYYSYGRYLVLVKTTSLNLI
jgi:hypothetical protein